MATRGEGAPAPQGCYLHPIAFARAPRAVFGPQTHESRGEQWKDISGY